MNKRAIIKKVIAHLSGEMEQFTRAAKAAHAEATHEQSKAENKYDTRGLEAAYLARGQSRQAAETAQALEEFERLRVRDFGPGDGIDVGALVELENRKERSLYLLGPRAGGTEIEHDKREVLVITPQSPLGSQLLGRKQGDRLQLEIGRSKDTYLIVQVC